MTSKEWSAASHFQRWLAAQSAGCYFIAKLAGRSNVAFAQLLWPPDEERMRTLDRAIEAASEKGQAIIFFWPEAVNSSDTVTLLKLLTTLDRWKVELADDNCISVRWKTRADKLTEVAGFAPLPEMPLTRRAPFLAIAVWGGDSSSEAVGLVDTPWEPGDVRKDPLWQKSKQRTKAMLDGEDRTRLRSVAFRLSTESRARLTELSSRAVPTNKLTSA